MQAERNFITDLFVTFNSYDIEYAVLRNAEHLPSALNGTDIDLLVRHSDFERALPLLCEIVDRNHGRITGQVKVPHFVQTEMLGCIDGSWWGCCIDLFDGVYVKSVLPLVDDSILEYRVDNGKGVWALPKDIGHYLGYVKELLVGGKRSERYFEGARSLVDSAKDNVLLSDSCRKFIRKALANDVTSAKTFIRFWMVGMATRHPIFFLKNWGVGQVFRIVRYFRPCGKMIVVMGTDGSGKSTLLGEIMPILQTMTHGSTVVHHLKPNLLPPLGRYRGVKYEPGHVCTDPHGSKPSKFLFSMIRITYLMCDYILGYWLKVRFRISKTPIGLWIFDRYAYDILLDPRRFRIQLPRWIIRVFLFFAPRPDLILCLGGDAEKIYLRKPETSLEEVSRQVQELRLFCENNRAAKWIDTTGTLTRSVQIALETIMENLGT